MRAMENSRHDLHFVDLVVNRQVHALERTYRHLAQPWPGIGRGAGLDPYQGRGLLQHFGHFHPGTQFRLASQAAANQGDFAFASSLDERRLYRQQLRLAFFTALKSRPRSS